MTISNEMIRASAGSGKTWQLTNRYIALMGQQLRAGGEVTPERIIAVTFTRKAAGEFFDSILEKLAEAASDPNKAQELASDKNNELSTVLGDLSQEEYLELLRIFVAKMPRLFLGTLDSFFSNILRSFPSEFGLAGDFEIIDTHLQSMVRESVCRHVFERKPERDSSGQRDFLEAFRRATFGKEGAGVQRTLDDFLEKIYGIWLRSPDENLWGTEAAIWPGETGSPWQGEKPDFDAEFEKLFAIFEAEEARTAGEDKPHTYSWDYWNEFREQAPDYIAGASIPKRVEYMLKNILPIWGDILNGDAELKLNRKINYLDKSACRILERIMKYFVRSEFELKLQQTRGIWTLLNQFETIYAKRIRRRGKLTFQDVELLLAGQGFAGSGNPLVLSQSPGEDERLQIDYRLDARYDHWMLDEFQDTSFTQWKAIANLIDEVVQDSSGSRSLFQVGDTKQAIYGWRGGDTRLFDDIANRYNANEERIKPRSLNVSWRSGRDVIDMVNRVFGNPENLSQLALPEATTERWIWENHEVPEKNAQRKGYCSLIHPFPAEGSKAITEEDRFAVVVALLKEIKPIQRGIDCAILVQQNKVGHDLVNYIRANCDVPVMSDADIPIAIDNAINRAAISYLKCVAHPGDTFAWNHLRMTPFGKIIASKKLTPGSLSAVGVKLIFEHGFEHIIQQFFKEIENAAGIPLDTFNKSRTESLALAARLFDERGSRDIDEFLAFARLHKMREPDTKSAVQVMTIHQSKGLTYDMVILPELEGKKLAFSRERISVKQDEDRNTKWILDPPAQIITQADSEISGCRIDSEANAAYDSLCKLYVALTRAKYANYLITSPHKTSSTSNNFNKLLHLSLAAADPREDVIGETSVELAFESDLPETTDRKWYQKFSIEEEIAPKEEVSVDPLVSPEKARVRVARRTPSGSEGGSVTGAQIFSQQGRTARELGTLVHALFEEIEWHETDSLDRLKKRCEELPGFSPEAKVQAMEQISRSLANQEVIAALSRPQAGDECWREKPFEILLENEWLSGTFDRVIIGKEKATILDFKTSFVDTDESVKDAVEKYRPQLETYRQVLARMTGLSEDAIEMQLLFTRIPKVVLL